uniref:Uncharacterized protein n=1 Tax=viral metagenome TaxID=1070528 RepID=A0A6H1ZD65_9ZZZZ
MIMMNLDHYSQALEKALIIWRGNRTRKRLPVSINEFARFLEFSRPIVSQWLNNDKHPSKGTVDLILPKLEELLGEEIYELLEIPRPDPDLQTLSRLWPRLSEETRHAIREQAEKYVTNKETNHENALR